MIISSYDAVTGETTDRDMTAAELIAYQLDVDNLAQAAKDELAATAKRQALLAKLGITADEAKLLLG